MSDAGGPQVPERIDHYAIDRRLALGGMAEIFLATDTKTGRMVALKKILPHLGLPTEPLPRARARWIPTAPAQLEQAPASAIQVDRFCAAACWSASSAAPRTRHRILFADI